MQSVEKLCEQLASGDQATEYRARRALQEMAAQAGGAGKAKERAELAAALAEELVRTREVSDPKKPKDPPSKAPALPSGARSEICRVLSLVATDAEIPALKQALGDFEVRESARFALDRMPTQSATDALVEAAGTAVGVEFLVGVVSALGLRSGSSVVEALKECASNKRQAVEVRLAAAEALANHAEPDCDAAILAVGGTGRAARRVDRARLRLAANLAAAGQKDAARKIYDDLADGQRVDEVQKKAARVALAQLG